MTELAALSLDQWADLALRWGANAFWALVVLAAGLVLAGWARRAVLGGLARVRRCDDMLRGFFASLAKWAVLVFTGIAVLERLGVETTSMVAVLGAAGLALGLALKGTLSNLAGGVMLLLFRPFTVGHAIESGALAGKVAEVSLFHTILVTGDNVQVVVPNGLLWNAALRNLSVHPMRRIEVVVPVPHAADLDAVMDRLRHLVAEDGRAAPQPAPSVDIVKLGEKTADIAVQAWCQADQAGPLKADLTAAIWRHCLRESGG